MSIALRTLALISLLLAPCVMVPVLAKDQTGEAVNDEVGFERLFDGQSFAGWEGDLQWFRIEDATIIAGSLTKDIPHNFFLCTKESYEDFELRLEAKLVGKGDNAGIQFRTARIANHHEVSGYQADMGMAWDRPVWGALYDESRRNKMLAEGAKDQVAMVLKPGDWNEIVVRCEGARVQIWLNGLKTVDFQEQDPQILRSGVIGLQIHGGAPAEASYRKIRLKRL
jgi:hypothetical protein